MNKLIWILATVGATALAVYLALMVYLMINQAKMIYFPHKDMDDDPSAIGLAYENLTLRTKDNVAINGWFVPSDNAIATVLFCHGNAGNISGRLETIQLLHSLNLSVMIFDYRGYGKSEGAPSEKGTYKDARTAWDFLISKKKIESGKIIIMGRSLGGAIASHLATKVKPGGLIIESSFKSIKSLGGELYPYFPVGLIARIQYNTIGNIKKIRCPLLVVHSPDDDVIPYHHGQEIFKAAHEPKQFLEIVGGHNDGFLQAGENYIVGLSQFLKKITND